MLGNTDFRKDLENGATNDRMLLNTHPWVHA
jgi:hypothetical protein